jgi:hypothetical protein
VFWIIAAMIGAEPEPITKLRQQRPHLALSLWLIAIVFEPLAEHEQSPPP